VKELMELYIRWQSQVMVINNPEEESKDESQKKFYALKKFYLDNVRANNCSLRME
jgi:hypothetical protein